MNHPSDIWYVRFPDGRVARAAGTEVVRHHLETGQIPPQSRVRRSGEGEWLSLDWIDEFSDLVKSHRTPQPQPREGPPPARPARARPARGGDNGLQLQTLGVRGLAEGLLTALDNTLVRSKLLVAALIGLAGGTAVLLARVVPFPHDLPWSALAWGALALAVLVVESIATSLLTRMTYLELALLRPPRWSECVAGLGRAAVRLMVVQAVVVGLVLLLLFALRYLPAELLDRGDTEGSVGGEVLAAVITVLRLVLEVGLWPILGLTLLLAPVVVVEESSPFQTLAQWVRLIHQNLTRVFVYEGIVFALGAIMTFPLVFPVGIAAWTAGAAEPVAFATLAVLAGLALAPLCAYLIVANVFIYLNLRYDHRPAVKHG
jgi:hypothetical protein